MQEEQNFQNFQDTILDEIEDLTEIAGQPIALSTQEMDDLAQFMLDRDENGNTYFSNLLRNPQVYTQAAFWVLKGPEIMDEMSNEIQAAYQRGFNDAQSKSKPAVVFKPQSNSRKTSSSKGPHYNEEESWANITY